MQRLFARGLFKNKVNIVTGGGTGIGFGTAAGLAQLGSKVVIASRSKDKIDEAVERLQVHCHDGAEILGLQCNIRDRENVSEMISATIDKFGKLDGLVQGCKIGRKSNCVSCEIVNSFSNSICVSCEL